MIEIRRTEIKKVDIDWTEIKNECRHTTNKSDTDIAPTKNFILKLLISEHSPIRLAKIKFRWANIKSWISVHFARHWLGWDKWISTQRTDRTGVDRDSSRQDTPVNMDVEANPQALINVARYRLCFQASPETREHMIDLKFAINDAGQEEISYVLVPNCVYRFGCPEFTPCGFGKKFFNACIENNIDTFNINARYKIYNEMLKKENGYEGN